MIAALIRWSLGNRFLVLLATVLVSAWGVYSVLKTPLDALPEVCPQNLQMYPARSSAM